MGEAGLGWRGGAGALALCYGACFLVNGALMPFFPAWLEARGLAPEAIGLALGLGMAARFAVAPLTGWAADRTGRRRLAMTLAAGAALIAYGLLGAAHAPWLIIAVTALASAAYAPVLPLLETSAVSLARAQGFSYGRVRSVGSAAFILANVVLGWLIARLGAPDIVLAWLLAMMGLLLAATFALPPDLPAPKPSQARHESLAALLQPAALFALLASASVQASHAFYYSFSILHWRAAGLNADLVGLLWAWGVLVEIVLLSVFGRRAEALGPARLLALGAAAGLVRWTAFAFITDPWALFAFQTLHAGTFAAAHLGAVSFIAARLPPGGQALAQTLNSAIGVGGALALATTLSGALYEAEGGLGYLAMTALCALGLLAAAALGAREARSPR